MVGAGYNPLFGWKRRENFDAEEHIPHEFMIEKRKVSWIELCDLIKADDPSPFPALTQIEVYGNDL